MNNFKADATITVCLKKGSFENPSVHNSIEVKPSLLLREPNTDFTQAQRNAIIAKLNRNIKNVERNALIKV